MSTHPVLDTIRAIVAEHRQVLETSFDAPPASSLQGLRVRAAEVLLGPAFPGLLDTGSLDREEEVLLVEWIDLLQDLELIDAIPDLPVDLLGWEEGLHAPGPAGPHSDLLLAETLGPDPRASFAPLAPPPSTTPPRRFALGALVVSGLLLAPLLHHPAPLPAPAQETRLLAGFDGDRGWIGIPASPDELPEDRGDPGISHRHWYYRGVRAEHLGRYEEAAAAYREAIRWTSVPSRNNLALLIARGRVAARDGETVLGLLRSAAEAGHAIAQINLAALLAASPESQAEAARWCLRAAEVGHPLAQNNLSALYLEGRGVARDVRESLRWLTQAAGKGVPIAQYNLGLALQEGLDGRPDYPSAFWYYHRAAESGLAAAQYKIGLFLERGLGTTPDLDGARTWYHRAAEQGHDLAQERLREL